MLIFCFQKIQLSCFSIGMISIEDHANKLINIKNYIHIIFSVVYDGFLTVFFGLILSDRIIILFILISQSSRWDFVVKIRGQHSATMMCSGSFVDKAIDSCFLEDQ